MQIQAIQTTGKTIASLWHLRALKCIIEPLNLHIVVWLFTPEAEERCIWLSHPWVWSTGGLKQHGGSDQAACQRKTRSNTLVSADNDTLGAPEQTLSHYSLYSVLWSRERWLVVRHPRFPGAGVEQRLGVGAPDVPRGQCKVEGTWCSTPGSRAPNVAVGQRSVYKCWSRCGAPGAASDRVVTPRTHPTIHPALLGADKVVTPPVPTLRLVKVWPTPWNNTHTKLKLFMICKVEPNIVNIGSKWNAAVKWQQRCKIASSDCWPGGRNPLHMQMFKETHRKNTNMFRSL